MNLQGLSAGAALGRLLELRGASAGPLPSGLEERAFGVDELQQALEAHAVVGRLAQAAAAELPSLELPTLVQLADQSWAVAREHAGTGLLVEAAGGPRRVEAEALSGLVLDASPPVSYQEGLGAALLALLGRHPGALAEIAAVTALVQLAGLLPPLLTAAAFDRALPQGAASLLALFAGGVLLSRAFQAAMGWLRQRTVLHLQTRLQTALDRSYLDHLLHLPFAALQGRSTGELLQSMTGLATARDLATERLLGAALDGATGLGYLAVMAATLPGPTLPVFVGALIMAAATFVSGRVQARWQEEEVEAQARQRSLLLELLGGIATIKAAGAERAALGRWTGRLLGQLAASSRRQRAGVWSDTGLEAIRQGLQVAVLAWGGALALRGEVTVGGLLAFLQLATLFLASALGLAGAAIALVNVRPVLATARELAALPPEPRLRPARAGAAVGPVVLDEVWFRYGEAAPWVLQGASLRVEEGEKRWLRGPSGSGKTTMLRLLAGLQTPTRGRATIAGQDALAARGAMSYLPQFVHLYGGSLLDNLRLLSGGAPRARLLAAAQASGLAAFVETLPMGHETVLPPGGGNLSGGQRQLVALTAVMASDRRLLLLDEAFANLDWLSRAWVASNEYFADKTVIYVSHDAGLGTERA